MALTRKFLRALGIEDDKVEEIIGAHLETVNPLKDERDNLKEQADKAAELQKQVDALTKQGSTSEDLAKKYEDEHAAFEAYKAEVEAGKAESAKKSAYRKLLESSGIDPKRIDAVMRVSDVSTIEVGEDGNIVDADKLTEQIKADWSDFVISTGTVGQRVDTPPAKQQGKPEPTSLAEALHQKYNI
jgi:hypothetical protein